MILLLCLCLLAAIRPSDAATEYTNSWVIHVPAGEERARQIAEAHGFQFLRQVGTLEGMFHVQHVCADGTSCLPRNQHSKRQTDSFLEHDDVLDAIQQTVVKRERRAAVQINDPLWPHMWYMEQPNGDHIHVRSAWEQGITGAGVVVTVVDDGIEHTHPDLIENYDAHASIDLNGNDDDPFPNEADPINKHGTRCCGEVAAAKNNICGVGVAYDSKIGAVRMLDGEVSDVIEASSLGLRPEYVDIYSSSWGPNDNGMTMEEPGYLCKAALEKGVKNGRNGLGSIFLFASGNGGSAHDDCNMDGYTNSIYTIAIGAVTEHHAAPWYAEPCAAGVVVTYSSGSAGDRSIVSVDLHNACTEQHSGTSAAAPLAAGILALVLQVNPLLSWRDVQHLLIRTAIPFNDYDSEWFTTKAGYKVHHKFYFGKMNVESLVNAARDWKTVGEQVIYRSSPVLTSSNLPVISVLSVSPTTTTIRSLEHVQVTVSMTNTKRGDLTVKLICPSGTYSTLLSERPNDRAGGNMQWTFMTTRCWDESPIGNWTLEMQSHSSSTLHSWTLILYGTAPRVVICNVGYFASSSGICQQCDAQCDQGCTDAGPSHCTKCAHYLMGDTCVSECVNNTYSDDQHKICQPCHSECIGCSGPGPQHCYSCKHIALPSENTGASECVASCLSPYIYNGTSCVCNSSYYTLPSGMCQACNPECVDGCSGPDPAQCVKCRSFQYGADCVVSCPTLAFQSSDLTSFQSINPGVVVVSSQFCLPCHTFCASGCQGATVDNCADGSAGLCIAYQMDGTCFASCPSGSFAVAGSNICQPCHAECDSRGCTGSDATSCIGCAHFRLGNQCVGSCPAESFADKEGVCNPCHRECAGACHGESPSQCCVIAANGTNECCTKGDCAPQCQHLTFENTCLAACPANHYPNGDLICLPCDNQCFDGCSGPTASACTSCRHFRYQSECVSECPKLPSIFADTSSQICQQCDSSCGQAGCHGPLPSDCNVDCSAKTCPVGERLNEQCNCLPLVCEHFRDEDRCVDNCPTDKFGDTNGVCHPCSDQCGNGCYGPSANQCNSCLNVKTVDGECVALCPTLTYHDQDDDCIPCHSMCAQGCAGQSDEDCIACAVAKSGTHCVGQCPTMTFISDGSCLQCHSECADGCHGPDPSQCTSCRTLSNAGVCVSECPSMTFEQTGQCVSCNEQCLSGCSGSTSMDCKGGCRSFEIVATGECVSGCPLGYFADQNHCLSCDSSCGGLGCLGPGATDCVTTTVVSTKNPTTIPPLTATKPLNSPINGTQDEAINVLSIKYLGTTRAAVIAVLLVVAIAIIVFLVRRNSHKGKQPVKVNAKYALINGDEDFALGPPKFSTTSV